MTKELLAELWKIVQVELTMAAENDFEEVLTDTVETVAQNLVDYSGAVADFQIQHLLSDEEVMPALREFAKTWQDLKRSARDQPTVH